MTDKPLSDIIKCEFCGNVFSKCKCGRFKEILVQRKADKPLNDKIIEVPMYEKENRMLKEKDVREAVKKLKERVNVIDKRYSFDMKFMLKEIDEIFGDMSK